MATRLPDGGPEVSVVIVSFNTRELLRECLRSVFAQSEIAAEVVVVDNASQDGSAEMVAREFPSAKLIASTINLGFAAANNAGFEVARGRYVVLLNADAFLHSGDLALAVRKMDAEPHTGLAGGRLIGCDGGWQPSARLFPSLLNDWLSFSGLATRFPQSKFFGRADRTWASPEDAAHTDWVPGAFSIVRSSALKEAGYFDESFFLYYEEVDLCRRIKALGYRIAYWPELKIVHLGGESSKTIKRLTFSSSGAQLTLWRMRSALLYYRKHHGMHARLALWSETLWHRARAWRNQHFGNGDAEAKVRESRLIIQQFKRAWKETDGGRVCPQRPW